MQGSSLLAGSGDPTGCQGSNLDWLLQGQHLTHCLFALTRFPFISFVAQPNLQEQLWPECILPTGESGAQRPPAKKTKTPSLLPSSRFLVTPGWSPHKSPPPREADGWLQTRFSFNEKRTNKSVCNSHAGKGGCEDPHFESPTPIMVFEGGEMSLKGSVRSQNAAWVPGCPRCSVASAESGEGADGLWGCSHCSSGSATGRRCRTGLVPTR